MKDIRFSPFPTSALIPYSAHPPALPFIPNRGGFIDNLCCRADISDKPAKRGGLMDIL